jgi:hypothetical protein
MIINPDRVLAKDNGEKILTQNGYRLIQEIEINIGITEITSEGGKAGIGIITGFLSGGMQKNEDNSNHNVSSIKFKIPVALPSTKRKN